MGQVAFVLSGSDCRVHLYYEDPVTHAAKEKKGDEHFPELSDEFPSVVLWIAFQIVSEKWRLTSIGCECGQLFLYKVDLKSNSLVSSSSINHGSSVTSSRFFYVEDNLNLLATNALLPADVYL